ncbi:hypothetical protein HPB47_019879 [Ixodes persulcatus]|uniref:Uncharacterized protein n=1 Tax=Ixodes persulcatus TaxID=34615 RepID=A0AC60QKF4_IXOPE|nr:hypothetical protein HPB47_019879 [Ixodes persulcatus]
MDVCCREAMCLMQARLRQFLVMEMKLDSMRSESETLEMALHANSFTIAAFAMQGVERIERELWSYERGESWFETTLPHLGDKNFKACFRVLPCTFRYLVDVCRPAMTREETNMRTAISVEKRVAIGLYKLCSTAENRTIAALVGVGRSTVNRIYREFCATVVANLEQSTVTMVRQSELHNHMLKFEAVCGFPSAIGALDGCHLGVSPPKGQDCDYQNYKGEGQKRELIALAAAPGARELVPPRCALAHTSSEHVERKLALQNPEILGSIPTPARFDLDEHRTGVWSCITTAWCTLKTPG